MTTLTYVVRTARKAHRCDSCGGQIPSRTRYRFWSGVLDICTGIQTAKECPACSERAGRPIPAKTPEGTS